ncbi:nitroreductase-like protein [Nannochloropsis gaditana]|uniref:Nitroreductase-like protein n=1 Tax=Nannochloropsis gaditana TaxID=72520 RepID=W7U3M3_9STRA|nr:nitroreductase-like protein [Nannochloropsis gaditana]
MAMRPILIAFLLLVLLPMQKAFLVRAVPAIPVYQPPPPCYMAVHGAGDAISAPSGASVSLLAGPFSQIVHSRFSNTHYASHKPVHISTLNELLRLTQRAPSSFNIQPFKLVVIRDPTLRDKVGHQAMLGANGNRVRTAPVTVVFAADVESSRLMPQVVALLRQAGTFPEGFLKKIPFFANLFSTGYPFSLLRWCLYWGKRVAMHVVGWFKAVPRLERPETWAVKNTMLAAMTFMLAASSHGLTTCPMEGFDARRLRHLLGLPTRYVLPVVVSLGYAATPGEEAAQGGKEGHAVSSKQPPPSLRFPMEEVVCEEAYGRPWKGVA